MRRSAGDSEQKEDLTAAEKAFHELRFMHTSSNAQPSGWWVTATIAVAVIALTLSVVGLARWANPEGTPETDVLLGGYISPEEARTLPPPPDLGPFQGFSFNLEWAASEPDLSGTVTLIHDMHHDSDCDRSANYLGAVQNLYGSAGLKTVLVIDDSFGPYCDIEAAAFANSSVARSPEAVSDGFLLLDPSGRVRFEAQGFPAYKDLTTAIATTLVEQ